MRRFPHFKASSSDISKGFIDWPENGLFYDFQKPECGTLRRNDPDLGAQMGSGAAHGLIR